MKYMTAYAEFVNKYSHRDVCYYKLNYTDRDAYSFPPLRGTGSGILCVYSNIAPCFLQLDQTICVVQVKS